jgi:hypothetical protein
MLALSGCISSWHHTRSQHLVITLRSDRCNRPITPNYQLVQRLIITSYLLRELREVVSGRQLGDPNKAGRGRDPEGQGIGRPAREPSP